MGAVLTDSMSICRPPDGSKHPIVGHDDPQLVGSELEAVLDASVPAWIGRDWPLEDPRYVGRDLTWREWIDLPDLPGI